MSIVNQNKKSVFSDPSLWVLIGSNLVTSYFAVTQHWNLYSLMWVYWSQSVIIGLVNFFRIVEIGALPNALFFAFHYGFFHFCYAIFLAKGNFALPSGSPHVEPKYILISAATFFISHVFSYFYNRTKDNQTQDAGALMGYPYARIIPMHLTIIFGTIYGSALPLFLLLKTFADIIMHIVEHRLFRKSQTEL